MLGEMDKNQMVQYCYMLNGEVSNYFDHNHTKLCEMCLKALRKASNISVKNMLKNTSSNIIIIIICPT